MIKLTPVTKHHNKGNAELINGNFEQILRGLSGELSKLGNYAFVVVTKMDNND